MDDDVMALGMLCISMPVLAVLSWCCTLPLIIGYSALVALRTRGTVSGLVRDIPALLVGVVTAILAIGLPLGVFVFGQGPHAYVRFEPAGLVLLGMLFAMTFILAFGASFTVIEGSMRLTRHVATRLRNRRALSEPDELTG